MVVFHDGLEVHRFDGLRPDEDHELLGRTVRTLPRPHGELLCRLATVNDVHFGELEAGRIDDHAIGPVQRPEPGEAPFPETMNRAAVAEMSEADLAAVIVKGDLTADGTDAEFEAFERCYRPAFGDRLAVVRGNHDAYHAQTVYAGDRRIDLPGVTVALIDTTIPEHTTGRITAETFAFLDDLAAERRPTGDGDGPPPAMGRRQPGGRLLRHQPRRQRRADGADRRGGRRSSPTRRVTRIAIVGAPSTARATCPASRSAA